MELNFCSLYSGSSGNCTYLASDHTSLLIDAGVAGNKIEQSLALIKPKKIDAILITHEHIDHIRGAGVLSRKYDIPIYANAKTWEEISPKIGSIKTYNTRIFDTNGNFLINDINIMSHSIPHDAADPVCFSFVSNGVKVASCTDLGYFPNNLTDVFCDCDLILLEANHDLKMLNNGSYPPALKRRISSNKGHLSNESCANAIVKLTKNNIKNIILGHLSQENNSVDLAYNTIIKILSKNGITSKDVNIYVSSKDTKTRNFLIS